MCCTSHCASTSNFPCDCPGWFLRDLLSHPCLLACHRLLICRLDIVSSIVAAQPSRLPWLVIMGSPLVALPLPPDAAAWDSGGRQWWRRATVVAAGWRGRRSLGRQPRPRSDTMKIIIRVSSVGVSSSAPEKESPESGQK